MFWAGCFFYIIGFIGAFKLAQLMGGFHAQFTEGGHYNIEWTGAPVKYNFFASYKDPGLVLCLLALLYKPTKTRILIVAVQLIYPLAITLFLGRRTHTATLGAMVLLSFYYRYGWAPSKKVFLLGLTFMALFVILAPAFRSQVNQGNFGHIKDVDKNQVINSYLKDDRYKEIDTAVMICSAFNQSETYNWGIDFYNGSVSRWIPRQVVGEAFKQSLMIKTKANMHDILWSQYQWEIPFGSFTTGIAHSFAFWSFFGCLFFYVISRFSFYIFSQSISSLFNQVVYFFVVIQIPMFIIESINKLPSVIVNIVIVMVVVQKFNKLIKNKPFFIV
ncbi:MAG: hypothetical protein PHQ49_07405 [Clostridia bacterium]|nr:hypothetical protein [Clostridia bacterium]